MFAIFQCRKCRHLLYVDVNDLSSHICEVAHSPCPNCGESSEGQWAIVTTSQRAPNGFSDKDNEITLDTKENGSESLREPETTNTNDIPRRGRRSKKK